MKTIQELYQEGYLPIKKIVRKEMWEGLTAQERGKLLAEHVAPEINGGKGNVYIFETEKFILFFVK